MPWRAYILVQARCRKGIGSDHKLLTRVGQIRTNSGKFVLWGTKPIFAASTPRRVAGEKGVHSVMSGDVDDSASVHAGPLVPYTIYPKSGILISLLHLTNIRP